MNALRCYQLGELLENERHLVLLRYRIKVAMHALLDGCIYRARVVDILAIPIHHRLAVVQMPPHT